jgi:hypothetical protein
MDVNELHTEVFGIYSPWTAGLLAMDVPIQKDDA